MSDTYAALRAELDRSERAAIARLTDWLRIPSISTDPAHAGDCAQAAEWAAEQLRECGLTAELCATGDPPGSGRPVVLAQTPGSPGYEGPHVLFYGHYDVQPADPLELWDSPPFEPVIRPADGTRGERIVARGAVDDKGQVMMFVEALRACVAAGLAPAHGVRLTVLLEGEEESGSANLERFLRDHRPRLADCNVCIISDTGMLGRGRPAITCGIRGLAYTEVTLHGPSHDLHSGMWGGKIPNPINELARILAQLWDADRRVTIPGFYDGVRTPSQAQRAAWRQLGIDDAHALRGIGLPPEASIGERGYTMTEREWARPTCDINGIFGGYTGVGAKTIIASKATAKVSFRLVDDQDPDAVMREFFAWLAERTPPGCRWETHNLGAGRPATVPEDSPVLHLARRAVERACGVAPALIRTGGSIPVAAMLKAMLGLDTVFMGFGLDDDRVHSPNEKFELDCFRMGERSHAALLAELAHTGAS